MSDLLTMRERNGFQGNIICGFPKVEELLSINLSTSPRWVDLEDILEIDDTQMWAPISRIPFDSSILQVAHMMFQHQRLALRERTG